MSRLLPVLVGKSSLLTVAVALLLGGCGSLVVDVDMYKGPLTNHEDVLAEEAQSLVIGAKPLLVRLRNDLEKNARVCRQQGRSSNQCAQPYEDWFDRIEQSRDCSPYDYLDKWCLESAGFVDADARRVNSVLGLYKDRGLPGLTRYLTESAELLSVYDDLRADYGPDKLTDKRFWESYSKRFYLNEAEFKNSELYKTVEKRLNVHLRNAADRQKILKEFSKSVIDLTEGYRCFHFPSSCGNDEKRDVYRLARAHNKIRATVKDVPALQRRLGIGQQLGFPKSKELSGTEVFLQLRDGDLAHVHAGIILKPGSLSAGEEDEFRTEFVGRSQNLARLFLSMRSTLDQLLVMALDAIEELNTGSAIHGADYRMSEVNRAAADLVVYLVKISALRAALRDPLYTNVTGELEARLGNSVTYAPGKPFCKKGETPNRSCVDQGWLIEKGKIDLRSALIADPVRIAKQLRRIHFGFRNQYNDPANIEPKWQINEKRKFGIALTFPSLDKVAVLRENLLNFGTVARASSLEYGRLDLGLENLIEKYLRIADVPAGERKTYQNKQFEQAGHSLSAALVRFGQKVLVLANFGSIFESSRNDAQCVPNEANDYSCRDAANPLDDYTAMLQALGNSLIVLADDIRKRHSHQRKLDDWGETEITAMQEAFAWSHAKAYDHLITSIGERHAGAVNKLAEQAAKAQAGVVAAESAVKAATKVKSGAETPYKRYRDANALLQDGAGRVNAAIDKVAPPDPFDRAKYLKSILDKVKTLEDSEINAHEGISERAKKLGELVKVIEEKQPVLVAQTELIDKEKTIQALKATVSKQSAHYKKAYTAAGAQLEKTKNELKTAKAQKSQVIDKYTAPEKRLGKILEILKKNRSGVVSTVSKDDQSSDRSDYSAVTSELLAVLDAEKVKTQSQLKKEGDAGKKKILQSKIDNLNSAMSEVRKVPVPSRINPAQLTRHTKDKNSKAALDALAAFLRHEHTLAIRSHGPGSEEAKKIKAALDNVRKQRADMMYLRPSVAYLRSSYPASALQDDPKNVDPNRNLLREHALRSSGSVADQRKLRTLMEADKHNWQSVNQVRVSGAGRTNYVIVKDDVGNWYVKGYSADPASIFKAAKSMMLFAGSAQAGANLVTYDRQLTEAKEKGGSLPELKSINPQAQQLEAFNNHYRQQWQTDYETIRAAADGLNARISTLWKAHPDIAGLKDTTPLTDALNEPQQALSGALPDEKFVANDASSKELAEKSLNVVEAMRSYHNQVAEKVRSVALTDSEAMKGKRTQVEAQQKVVDGLESEWRQAEQKAELAGERVDALTDAGSVAPELIQAEKIVHRERQEEANSLASRREQELQKLAEYNGELATAEDEAAKGERARETARELLSETVRDVVLTFIERRQTAAQNQESALSIIGSTAAAPESEAEKGSASAGSNALLDSLDTD